MTRHNKLPPKAVGALALVATSAFIAITMTGLIRKPFQAGGRTVYADFQRAAQVQKGDQVRIDGHIEGRVEELHDLPGGRGVRVSMTVEDDAGPLFANARAHTRVKTLLAGSYYIDLERGSARAGDLGSAPIPLARTSAQVEIEDVTDIFRADAVSGLRILPRELAIGLRDPEAPTRALETLDRQAPDLRRGLQAARGRDAGRDLPAVVANVDRAVKALDSPTDELQTLISGAAATVRTTAARAGDLRSTVRLAPTATWSLRTTLARLRTTLDVAHGLVSRLKDPAPEVARTLATLHPAVVSTDDLLVRAQPLLRALHPAVRSLAGGASDGAPLLDGLRPTLRRTKDEIIPALAEKDERTGKSTSVMIGGFAAGFGGIAAQQDQNGHLIRFPASITSNTAHLPCSSSVIDAKAGAMLACETLEEALNAYLEYFPISSSPTRKGP